MTRSKLLLPGVIAVAAAAAFWFLVLAPKREEVSRLDGEIAAQQQLVTASEGQAAAYAQAKDNYRENYTTVVRLGKAVPADDDVRSLLVQLDGAAKESKVDFRSVNLSGGGGAAPTDGTTPAAASADGLAPAPGAVPVGSAGFSAMPFTFAFNGTFFRLSDFFTRLEKFVTVQNDNIDVTGRLLLLGSISVTPDSGDTTGTLTASIGAATYLVPPATGLTGGASPAAPAGIPDAGAAPATDDGGTVTPTATIPGVR